MKKTTKKPMMKTIIHYPNLQTVLMVEEILKKEKDITRTELKKKLPKKIMHQTLNVIIQYLEDSGKVIDHRTGIIWTYNDNPKFRKLVENSTEWTETVRKLSATHDKTANHTIANENSTPHILRRSEKNTRNHRSKKGKRIRSAVALHH